MSMCFRFVNRKCEDACSKRTKSHGISHSDRTAQLNKATREWVVSASVCVCVFVWLCECVVLCVCVCVSFNMGGPVYSV